MLRRTISKPSKSSSTPVYILAGLAVVFVLTAAAIYSEYSNYGLALFLSFLLFSILAITHPKGRKVGWIIVIAGIAAFVSFSPIPKNGLLAYILGVASILVDGRYPALESILALTKSQMSLDGVGFVIGLFWGILSLIMIGIGVYAQSKDRIIEETVGITDIDEELDNRALIEVPRATAVKKEDLPASTKGN